MITSNFRGLTAAKAALYQFFDTHADAVLVKELRQEVRSRAFLHSLVWFHGLMWLLVLMLPVLMPTKHGATGLLFQFWFIAALPLIIIVIRSFTSFVKETTAGELELIWLTPISAERLVFFKWVAFVAQACMFVTAALPYGLICCYLASVSIPAMLTNFVFLFIATSVCAAAGVAVSALVASRSREAFTVMITAAVFVGPALFMLTIFNWPPLATALTNREILTLLLFAPLFCLTFIAYGAYLIAPRGEHAAWFPRLTAMLGLFVATLLLLVDAPPGLVIVCLSLLATPVCLTAVCEPGLEVRELFPKAPRFGPIRSTPLRMFFAPGWESGTAYALVMLPAAVLLLAAFSGTGSMAFVWALLISGAFFFPLIIGRMFSLSGPRMLIFFGCLQILCLFMPVMWREWQVSGLQPGKSTYFFVEPPLRLPAGALPLVYLSADATRRPAQPLPLAAIMSGAILFAAALQIELSFRRTRGGRQAAHSVVRADEDRL